MVVVGTETYVDGKTHVVSSGLVNTISVKSGASLFHPVALQGNRNFNDNNIFAVYREFSQRENAISFDLRHGAN